MVEESGIFRYNNSAGGGTSAFDQCDSGDFSESDLSLLMRYQWVLYLILMLAFVDRYASEDGKTDIGIQWVALLAAGILVFNYGVSDNIGYSNLEKNTRRPMRTVYVCWTGSSRRKGTIREFPLHWWVSSGMMNSPLRILPEKSRTV